MEVDIRPRIPTGPANVAMQAMNSLHCFVSAIWCGIEASARRPKMGEDEMGMMKYMPVIGLAVLLAGCGGEKQAAAPVEEVAAKLSPGLYEVSYEVTSLTSTDKTTPATKLRQGDKGVIKACVAADNKPAPELLGEEGDKCEIKNSYIHNGRMSAQMSCTRSGKNGLVMPAMMGSFTADGFEGEISSLTYFVDDGDYRMTRKVTAKRIGDCPAAPTEPSKA